MPTEVPFAITLAITLTKLVVVLLMWPGFYLLVRRDDASRPMSAAGLVLSTIVWLGWALASSLLAAGGFFTGFLVVRSVPILPIVLVATLIAGWAVFALWPALRRVLEAVPQHWLIGMQVMRVIGGSFLVVMALGGLPGLFAWPAGIGDILTGVAAPFVAYSVYKGSANARAQAVAWNLFGILDLVVAISTGFVSSALFARFLHVSPDSGLLTQFPLTQIPTFLVPVAILAHLLSLRGLRSWQSEKPAGAPLPAAASR